MKKIISSIVIAAMMLTLFSTVSFAKSVGMNIDEKTELLQKLEVLNGDLPPLEQQVTRGEFVTLLAKLLKVDASAHSEERYYVDINEDSDLWNITAQLVNYVLTVPQDRRFRPDDIIQRSEAACALMKAYGAGIMEYKRYSDIANRMELLEGVSYGGLTYEDVINLLYNALTGYPMTFTGEGITPGGQAFMELYYDMFYVSGVVNAVNKSDLDGNGSGRVESIRVGDLTIMCELDNPYLYLGREVGVFYTSKDDPQLFYIYAYTDKNDIIEITEKNHPVFDETSFKLEYYNEDDRITQIQIPQTVNVVYNGQNMTNDVKGAFDLFEVGKITVLSAKNENDTVIIESYYDISVMSVNVDEGIIYGKDGNVISTDPRRRPVYIKDVNGNDVSLDSISQDCTVSVFESNVYLKLIVSNALVTGSISGIQNDRIVKLVVGDVAYELIPNKTFTYSVGEQVSLYLNYSGYVSSISTERRDGMKYAWLIGHYISTDFGDEGVYVKIFNEDSAFSKLKLAEKTRIDGTLRQTPDLQVFGLEKGKSGVNDQMILYKTNGEGLIKEIDTIAPNTSGEGLLKEFSNSEGTYGSTSVGKLIWTSSSTKVFVLPSADNRDNEDAYAIGSRSLLETWGTNDVDSYRSAEHNKPAAAEVLVLRKDMFTSAKEQRGAYVVQGIHSRWDQENDEIDEVITLMSGSATKEYVLSKNFTQHDELVKGNIVIIALNGKNELSSVTLHYGEDKNGNEFKTLKEIGSWGDANHYIAVGKIVAVGDEYADLSITGNDIPTVRFPVSTTNIGVFDISREHGCSVGTKGDIAEAMMRGDIVALSMYRGTIVSIAIVKN